MSQSSGSDNDLFLENSMDMSMSLGMSQNMSQSILLDLPEQLDQVLEDDYGICIS